MHTKAIKTKVITARDDLFTIIIESLHKEDLPEKSIVVITSKVVAVTQGRIKQIKSKSEFDKLVISEADAVIGGENVTLTLKDRIFIPWAGIDRSNVKKGYVILWPDKPYDVAHKLCLALKKHYKLKKLGVVITDSYCSPLRKGVTAISLGYAGFNGVNDLRGVKDLFGNKLKVSQQSITDMLAASAHLVMGESSEQTPIVIIEGAPAIFNDKKVDPTEASMLSDQCIFKPLYKSSLVDRALTKKEKSSK